MNLNRNRKCARRPPAFQHPASRFPHPAWSSPDLNLSVSVSPLFCLPHYFLPNRHPFVPWLLGFPKICVHLCLVPIIGSVVEEGFRSQFYSRRLLFAARRGYLAQSICGWKIWRPWAKIRGSTLGCWSRNCKNSCLSAPGRFHKLHCFKSLYACQLHIAQRRFGGVPP